MAAFRTTPSRTERADAREGTRAPPRVAIVHDWLTGMRGGEKVLEIACDLFPEADIHTLIHRPGSVSPAIEKHRIVASRLNRLPLAGAYYRCLLPLFPAVAERMRLDSYDLVIAISHCVAHGVAVSPETRFVAYYLTPMRYAWDSADAYFAPRRRLDPRRWAWRLLRGRLRRWDRRAAARVGECLAACRNVRDRLLRCYGRDAAVIHPPVDTEFYRPRDVPREDFYLWVGALAPYKRIDLALEAFRGLDRRLIVIGSGQCERRARAAAPPNVQFLGWQPDEVLGESYCRARALIFPGEEDFGIVPLEAQACGCPVIAYGKGGALETVIDAAAGGREATGVFFGEPAAQSLADAVRSFERRGRSFNVEALRANAVRFSRETCARALRAYLLGRETM
ncbi:MAG TPA: glycosyltransferase family 4 protein [Planctomycetes bacterium]|nr:glycosyltransferase family 4 protein [Planctomycetota bacterium]